MKQFSSLIGKAGGDTDTKILLESIINCLLEYIYGKEVWNLVLIFTYFDK
jgi:hypothetical protein